MSLQTSRGVADMRKVVAGWRAAGKTVGLVPTMGALHAGHLSLVEATRRAGADHVVVSIFVNPTQFGPNEDLSKYPRQEALDLARLGEVGADLAYLPTVGEIYPDGFTTMVVPAGTIVADLEATFRPGHFSGVATVVAKLLIQVAPDIAAFGEKDYQQLLVIRRMARDLDIPCRILPVPTVRDDHGLALSSRNAYLTPDQLAIARRLNEVLGEIARGSMPVEEGSARLLQAGFDAVDYLALRDAETLDAPVEGRARRVLAVARLGSVRLLDNMAVD
ncbi:MAG: pantoate--beta-alanine ligase [Reyranella sp.]|nr:pantoate--beta-alanine ligase [Reyranella sp.]